MISLPDATERRTQFAAQVPDDVEWTFFDALRTLSSALRYDPERALVQGGRMLGDGEIGCYSSHYELWRALATDDTADRYLIFEDDIVADWIFVKRLLAIDSGAIGSDILRLQYTAPARTRSVRKSFLGTFELVRLREPGWGATAYLLHKRAAIRLVKALGDVDRPVDLALEAGWIHGVGNLAVFPFPVFQRIVPSQLGPQRWQGEAKPLRVKIRRGVVRLRDRVRRLAWRWRR